MAGSCDSTIVGLHELLLDRLEMKLRSDAPSAVRWFEGIGDGRAEYAWRHPDVWPRFLTSFDAPERKILSGLFDVRLGLDSLRFQSELALAATDMREFHLATRPIPVAMSALLDRLEIMGKHAHRGGMVDALVEQRINRAIARFRKRDPFLSARDATAHGSFVETKSWLSAPESDRLWEAMALQPGPREPLDSLYRGTPTPEHHDQTQKRLSNIETVTHHSLSFLLKALHRDR